MIPALGRQRQEQLVVQAQPQLSGMLETTQSYQRACFRQRETKQCGHDDSNHRDVPPSPRGKEITDACKLSSDIHTMEHPGRYTFPHSTLPSNAKYIY